MAFGSWEACSWGFSPTVYILLLGPRGVQLSEFELKSYKYPYLMYGPAKCVMWLKNTYIVEIICIFLWLNMHHKFIDYWLLKFTSVLSYSFNCLSKYIINFVRKMLTFFIHL